MTQELKDKALDILERSTIHDNSVKLPAEEVDTEVWSIVKDALTAAGGKYKKATNVFDFPHYENQLADAVEWLMAQLTDEEKPKRKGSKENPVTVIDMQKLASGAKSLLTKSILIKSAALNGDFANYSFEQEVAQNTTNTVNIKSGLLIHEDFKAAFKKLNPHLAVICEEIAADAIHDIDTIDDYEDGIHADGSIEKKVSLFSVSSFKLNGTGENEGVILTGEKRLSTGEYVGLQSPKIKWEDSSYQFLHDLRIAIDSAVSEVEKYMDGKCAPRMVQTEIFQEEGSLVEEGS